MPTKCPECGETLDVIAGDEMGSAPQRFACSPCQMMFERDASGSIIEVA